ncbi:hypothetical protein C8J56DRAFT_399153 [Mycena floridula]|nr:hypothetical protein C8J56DRAFT_399153 [Mycena floridula]
MHLLGDSAQGTVLFSVFFGISQASSSSLIHGLDISFFNWFMAIAPSVASFPLDDSLYSPLNIIERCSFIRRLLHRWSTIHWSTERSVSMIVAPSFIDSPLWSASLRAGSLFTLLPPGSCNETTAYRRAPRSRQDLSLDSGRRQTNETEVNE